MDLSWLANNYLTRGFWGDEAWTAGISRLPIKEIISITGQDFHPPFYYFIVHFVGGYFNYAEAPVRLISTFFFLLVPIIAYFLTQKFWATKERPSRLASIATSALILLSPILVTYAFEARSYGLLAFESVMSAYIFWRAKDEERGKYLWRILYCVMGGIMVYTHYYAWFILASHAFYLLLFERRRILPMLTSALGVLAIQLPWLPTLLGQTNSVKGSYWIGPINDRTHYEFFLRITGGDVVTEWQKRLAAVIGALIIIGIGSALYKKKMDNHHKFLLTWLIIPTLIPTIISFVMAPVFFYRYLIFSSIPLIILSVQTIKSWPRPLFILIVAAMLYMETQVSWTVFLQHPRSMSTAVQEMYQTKNPGDGPVYTVLPAFAEVLYYVGDKDQIIVTPEGLVQFSGKSLLDAYNRLGIIPIQEPPTSAPYWFLTPEKTTEFRSPQP